MGSERELLEKLIKEKLGKGRGTFEERSEKGRIDLVFEKEDLIWLIEAKKTLNYEALGQILSYESSYRRWHSPSKSIKLGIACKDSNEEIERACWEKGVKVFILKQGEGEAQQSEKAPICGICGSQMVKENEEIKCKTCEYFFGMSSKLRECLRCNAEFGAYPAVETKLLIALDAGKREFSWRFRCPNCRRKEPLYAYHAERGITFNSLAEMIKHKIREGEVTPQGLEFSLRILTSSPKEFIDFCLGRVKFYFGVNQS